MNYISVRCTSLLSRYFGQTESRLRSLFRKARAVSPCILFFDEFDTVAMNRYCMIRYNRSRLMCDLSNAFDIEEAVVQRVEGRMMLQGESYLHF